MLPKAGNQYVQERRGISAVQAYAAETGQIWRELNTGDVGIDGHMEFVSQEGHATGKNLAFQVKSGPSFFSQEVEDGWKFYPEEKHRVYWEAYPMPVILALHYPDQKKTYWVDVRQKLRQPNSELDRAIIVPRANNLENTEAHVLFETSGIQKAPFIFEISDVLIAMLKNRKDEKGFVLSYLDLFTHGLTNLARSLYFGMDIVDVAVHFNQGRLYDQYRISIGGSEYDFIWRYVKFLVGQNLCEINFSDCLIDWHHQQLVPTFLAPLTARGRALIDFISDTENSLIQEQLLKDGGGYRVAQEGFVAMDTSSYISRLPRIHDFQQAALHHLAKK